MWRVWPCCGVAAVDVVLLAEGVALLAVHLALLALVWRCWPPMCFCGQKTRRSFLPKKSGVLGRECFELLVEIVELLAENTRLLAANVALLAAMGDPRASGGDCGVVNTTPCFFSLCRDMVAAF